MTRTDLLSRPGKVLNQNVQLERRAEAARMHGATIYDFPSSVACSPVQLKAFDREIGNLHGAVAVANHEIYGDPLPRGVAVQRRGGDGEDAARIHAAAERGVRGGGGRLPYAERIQAAFGAHDVSGIAAHVGGAATEACDDMGASAYATGTSVAFRGAPDLHTAAHEAAHIVQQRAGVSLKGGVGAVGDRYEAHADRVAGLVVRGESAEHVLNEMVGGGRGGGVQQKRSVQRKDEKGEKGKSAKEDAKAIEQKVKDVVAGVEKKLKRKLKGQEIVQVRDQVKSQPAMSVAALVQQIAAMLDYDGSASSVQQKRAPSRAVQRHTSGRPVVQRDAQPQPTEFKLPLLGVSWDPRAGKVEYERAAVLASATKTKTGHFPFPALANLAGPAVEFAAGYEVKRTGTVSMNYKGKAKGHSVYAGRAGLTASVFGSLGFGAFAGIPNLVAAEILAGPKLTGEIAASIGFEVQVDHKSGRVVKWTFDTLKIEGPIKLSGELKAQLMWKDIKGTEHKQGLFDFKFAETEIAKVSVSCGRTNGVPHFGRLTVSWLGKDVLKQHLAKKKIEPVSGYQGEKGKPQLYKTMTRLERDDARDNSL